MILQRNPLHASLRPYPHEYGGFSTLLKLEHLASPTDEGSQLLLGKHETKLDALIDRAIERFGLDEAEEQVR